MIHARGREHCSFKQLGVCRYLENVSEVIAHVFYLCLVLKTIIITKQHLYEKTSIFTPFDLATNGGER